jgi:hypothetical protein
MQLNEDCQGVVARLLLSLVNQWLTICYQVLQVMQLDCAIIIMCSIHQKEKGPYYFFISNMIPLKRYELKLYAEAPTIAVGSLHKLVCFIEVCDLHIRPIP